MRHFLVAIAALTMFWLAAGVSPDPQVKSSGKKTTQKKTVRAAKADSLARADSIARVVADRVRVDSIRAVAEREAEARRIDSLRAESLRNVDNNAFGVGERLVFDVNYGFITAGEAILAVTRLDSIAGRLCYRIEVLVNSAPSFSWIYKVEDRYLTFIDVEAMIPWRFEQHIREGNYSRDFVAQFDQVRHIARTTEGEHEIPPRVHDIMSAFFVVRTFDFSGTATGSVDTLQNFYRNKTYDLGVKFLGRQELEVEAGTFKCIVVEPLVKEGGLFKSEGRIVVWLSDDDLKVPIRVNAKILIGSIDVELRQYSGLKGPLRARVR